MTKEPKLLKNKVPGRRMEETVNVIAIFDLQVLHVIDNNDSELFQVSTVDLSGTLAKN